MTAAERKEKAKAAEAEKLEAIRYIMQLDAKGAY